MLLTYSLKTGLKNNRRCDISPNLETTQSTAPCSSADNTESDTMPLNSSPFDCWARMIPRQLEDGVPPIASTSSAPPPSTSSDTTAKSRRRTRPEYRVLYSSQSYPPQQRDRDSSQRAMASAIAGGRRKKSVRFAPQQCRYHPVLASSSYSPSERQATWYTRRDLLRMKCEAGEVVALMRSGEYIDEYSSSSVTTRGLERHASEAHGTERRERKCRVVRAVLEEQERQRQQQEEEGGADVLHPHNARRASLSVSWESRDLALAAAQWDEYVVREEARAQPQTNDAHGWQEMPMTRVVSDDMEEDEPTPSSTSWDATPPSPSPSYSSQPQCSPTHSPRPTHYAEPMVVPPSPRGNEARHHKRSVQEVYFDNYNVLGSSPSFEVGDENKPPSDYYQYQQGYQQSYRQHYDYDSSCPQYSQGYQGGYQHDYHIQSYPQQQQHHLQPQHHAQYPPQQHCHGDRYQHFSEARTRRSIICR